MFGIMKKDWFSYIGIFLALPFVMFIWHMTRTQLDTNEVFMMTGWLYLIIFFTMFGVEMNEMKNRGYSFLATLPLSPREIVGAKFISILVTISIYVAVAYFTFGNLESSPALLALSRKLLLFNAAFALLLTGTMYWFIFRFGFEKEVILKVVISLALLLGILMVIALDELFTREHLIESLAVLRIARSAGNGSILAVGAVGYLICYFVSVRTYERESPA
jgi:hypothetical protein